jgi:hypothetical protein
VDRGVSWFLVSVPVLSEHSTSTPAISSIADNSRRSPSVWARASAPMCHGDREHCRHRHRCRCNEQDQHELQDGERILPPPVAGATYVAIDVEAHHTSASAIAITTRKSPISKHRPLTVADRPAEATSFACARRACCCR